MLIPILFFSGLTFYFSNLGFWLKPETEGSPVSPQDIGAYGLHSYNFLQDVPDEIGGEIEDSEDDD